MANEQNLLKGEDIHTFTHEEASKGGIASGKARREKKLIKESIEMVLGLEVKNEKLREQLKKLGIQDEDMTNQLALVVAMLNKGLKGDTQAFNSLRDTIGQKPVEKVETTEVPKIIDDVE